MIKIMKADFLRLRRESHNKEKVTVMAFICDVLMLFFAAVILVVRGDWIPFEEVTAIAAPFLGYAYWGMWLALLLKYAVYEWRLWGDMRYERPADKRPYYILMAGYPLLDLFRTGVGVGVLSAMLFGLVGEEYIIINVFAYYLILGGVIVAMIVSNYLCYASDSILKSVAGTAVFLIVAFILARGLPSAGLGMLLDSAAQLEAEAAPLTSSAVSATITML